MEEPGAAGAFGERGLVPRPPYGVLAFLDILLRIIKEAAQ